MENNFTDFYKVLFLKKITGKDYIDGSTPRDSIISKSAILNGESVTLIPVIEEDIIFYDVDPSRIDILNEYYELYYKETKEDHEKESRDYMAQVEYERMINGEIESWGDDWAWNID